MTRKLDGQDFAAGGVGAAILDSAHALVITLDTKGRIVGFNRACELLSGYEAEEVIGGRIWDKLLPEEAARPIQQFFATLREGGEIPEEYENAWVTKDGHRPIIAWNNSVVRNVAGEVELIVGIGVDVTERKANSDRLARAQQTAKIGSWEWTVATDREYWSDQMYRNLGLEPGCIEVAGDKFFEYVLPDDREGVRQALQATIETGKPYSFGFRVVWPDGTEHLVHEEGEALLGDNGETVALAGTMQDVTELRASENHLQRLATRLEYAQRVARIGNWEWDAATDRQWWSDECYRLIGHLPGEVEATDESFFAVIHPDDLSRARTDIDSAEKNGEAYEFTCRVNLRDGTERVIREVGYPAYNDNGIYVGQNGTLQDITEQYRAEQDLANTAHRLEEAERIALLGSWEWDPQSDRLTLSDQTYRLLGLEPGSRELTNEDYLQLVHPKDRQSVADLMRKTVESGSSYSTRYRIVRPDGGVRTISEIAEVFEVDGNGQRWLKGTVQDITERQRAEEELARTVKRLADAQTAARIGNWEWDAATDQDWWSEQQFRNYGIEAPAGFVPGYNYLQFVHPADREAAKQAVDRSVETGTPLDIEFRAIGADGVERMLWVCGANETNADGHVIRTVGTTLDVTERKRIERALQESEARLRGLFDYAPVGIGLSDLEGNLIEVNQQLADFLGYSTEEILKLSYRDYTHPDHLEVSKQQFEALLAGDIARASQEKLYIRRDGAAVWVNRTLSLIRDEAGAPRFVVVIAEDIDDRKRTEKELALATEQLEEAQRIGHIGHWEWRSGSTDTVWSDEIFRIFGMEPGAIHPTHDGFFGMVHEHDRESIASMMAETIESGQTYETEFRIVRADGATRHVFERGERFIDEQTGEWSVHGIMQDITERKAVEDKLRETAANLEKSQRIARLGSWIWDAEEDKEWWSDEIYRMFGIEVGSVVADGYGYLDYVHPDDRERVRAALEKSLREQVPYVAEYRIQHADGHEIIVSEQAETEYDRAGKPIRMRGIAQDITERKKAELILEQSKESLEEAQRIGQMGSWTWDSDGDVNWWSDQHYRIFGLEPGSVTLDAFSFLKYVLPDDRDRVKKVQSQAAANLTPFSVEYRVIWPDGTERIISEYGEYIENGSSGKPQWRGVAQDITERKRIEQELARLNAELEQRVEERTAELRAAQGELVKSERLSTLGQLTATVSHELRNPLGAMRTSMYVVEKKTDADDQRLRAAIDRVNRNITRCDQIIDELLDYTRIRDLNIQQTNIDNWLGAVLSEQTVPDRVEVTRKFRAGGARVPADSDRLRRAVINIFENACQAVTAAQQNQTLPRAPKVTVETRLKNDRLEILITDNGPGVPAEIREKIFEPLFSTKNFGVGLGLPTVRQIMKQHGGGVEIGERRGGGAKFALWLPVAGELEIANI